MQFPTLSFAFFLAVVWFFYWYIFRLKTQRLYLLTVAGYFFVFSWDWRFCVLLFASSTAAYYFGILIGTQKDYLPRKIVLIAATTVHVLFLCFFKYFYEILALLNQKYPQLYEAYPFLASLRYYSILMPLGVSYYTFKCLSYIFDIYLCKMRPVPFMQVLLYTSFFPQISSGPIVQAEYFFTQLPKSLSADFDRKALPIAFDRASLLIFSGLIKKTVFASFLTVLVTNKIFASPGMYNTIELLFGILSYTAIMYCDFSGYSDMAIGIALLFGFQTPKNFNRPYISDSVSEFWRRWHISFSSWLRDYLYFALGGSRYGTLRTLAALFITMLVAGIWHGASFCFLLWGSLQGLALCFEYFIYPKQSAKRDEVATMGVTTHSSKHNTLRIILVFIFVNISWLIFRSPSLSELQLYFFSLKNITKPFLLIRPLTVIILFFSLAIQLPSPSLRKNMFGVYSRLPLIVKILCATAVLLGLSTVSMSGIAPFIYFNF
ncbi:MBOAT family O-acyltransferase [Treponema phagedenis]|uniref:MBOAT family protein n=1 Tax=Treponema phagedenis TaxID=162 RepID=A0AAE6IVT3_TREPH|nr:MBOAT family O-acyltransferase [Treponema phagedenis]QEJ99127.1 MBOAT family protein [Treponema phagedenis]QEK04655.1 MBOAT family protein [Treponema phagedenis]QEK10312.1 MBOAT family protein [Treponema phagedenis]